ncbi:MAG: bifunctional oligoribonuclease/PAP phosphatase NrnA [Bacillota bacterium]|nr:bifunctional oligoribonuclease/PAP phosphatase NrnA [Bacillota bacterium]
MEINNIIKKIMESESIAITFHVSPDGDSLGSSLALYIALKKLNKDAKIICNDDIPDVYNFLPGIENISKDIKLSQDFDLVIVLDCGNKDRICSDIKFDGSYFIINIDHHKSNDNYGDINYVDPLSAAVGEIIYKLIENLNVPLDPDIASNIYTSILTDTGAFRFSNTTADTMKIASELLDKAKFDFSDIYRRIYYSRDFKRIKLYGLVIDSMRLILDGKAVIMTISRDMLKSLGTELGDTSDIINIGMEIDSIDAGILIKETEEGLKVSLRSKYLFDVSKVASRFGGGGHIRAAGLTLNTSIEEGEKLLTEAFIEELNAGNNKSL